MLRDGDSPRAQFYRRKDEVFRNRTATCLVRAYAYEMVGGKTGSEVMQCYYDLRDVMDKLDGDEKDSDTADIGFEILNRLDALLPKLGI